jgi:tetratricopeptide (TPR) repeat protein
MPGNTDALALQSIIAVAQNEKGSALDLAKKAVDAAPKSATARIALSYAQQANFDLEGALSSLREAVKSEPENALARARLSELLLSFGHVGEALEEAKKATAQNPGIARTQTVLGFAFLAQIKTKDSRAAFERAIELDQADPLPRLGLGLAIIRDGDVSGGRAEIEIAASLDPNSSLIRSYLAKAYYEEKRDKHASSQFTMAKEFDPNDPTPFFYDAIRKQTLNRPVDALHDMQKAISLNDNRAVYRSRLLLDDDLAARSASLGRIFSDLGFQPARDRPGERIAPIPVAPADQHQPGATQPRTEQPVHPGRRRTICTFIQRVQPPVQPKPVRVAGERGRGEQRYMGGGNRSVRGRGRIFL